LRKQDKSFTSTFFAPFETFERLQTDIDITAFFKEHFPNALPLIGEKELLRCFRENPRSPLLSIKCLPYHYKDKAILLGDSSHCMVPFYGEL
jgi:kynurenine 3-monooxygenase